MRRIRKITKEDIKEIESAWDHYQEITEYMYEEMIHSLSQKLGISEERIRSNLEDAEE